MRHVWISVAAAAGLSVVAAQGTFAADLGVAYKAPPPPLPVFSWTGFYIGGHFGDGWSTTETNANLGAALAGIPGFAGIGLAIPVSSQTGNGFLGGVQGGYNWQWSHSIVFGVEGDFSWTGIESNAPCLVVFNCNVKNPWTADFAGRVGVLATEKTMLFVKGGIAWAKNEYTFGNSITAAGATFAVNGTANEVKTGALFGMGVEYAFLPGWSAKIEYDYMDFGKDTLNFPIGITAAGAAVGANVPTTFNNNIHEVKAGVNWHF